MDEDIAEKGKQYEKYVLTVDPLIILVIKGHLLIEGLLKNIASLYVHDSAKLSNARLSFFQLTHLVSAMIPFDDVIPGSSWSAIEKLNKIRNLVAHNIDHKNLEKLVIEFVDLSLNGLYDVKFSTDEEKINHLEFCIGSIMGRLEAIKKHSE